MSAPKVAEKAYSIGDAAEIKSVSPDFIRRAIRATSGHVLVATKVGRGYRINASDLEAWWSGLPKA